MVSGGESCVSITAAPPFNLILLKLRLIANCIGSAIERDRTQRKREHIVFQRAQALEAYNQALQGRDRLFEATVKAANVLLTLENFDAAVNTALQFIEKGITPSTSVCFRAYDPVPFFKTTH